MGLQDDLKARTSALISQQMANWVVEIQRAIQGHQATLVRALDELGETVARYDEKVDEEAIGAAMAEVVAQQPPPSPRPTTPASRPRSPRSRRARTSPRCSPTWSPRSRKHIDRAAMFIVKSNAAVGWYAPRLRPPRDRQVAQHPAHRRHRVPDRQLLAPRHARPRHALARHDAGAGALGGDPQGILAVPLILRDKVAAVLYCDTPQDEVAQATADADRDPGRLRREGDRRAERRAAAGGRERRSAGHGSAGRGQHEPGAARRAGAGPAPAAAPPAPQPAMAAEPSGSSTVMWRPGTGRADHGSGHAVAARRRAPAPSLPASAAPAPRHARAGRTRDPGGRAESPRRRKAVRAPGGERDQALQRGEGHRGAQDEGHLRAVEGRHRARSPDVQGPRRPARPRRRPTTSTTSSCASSPGATRAPSGRCSTPQGPCSHNSASLSPSASLRPPARPGASPANRPTPPRARCTTPARARRAPWPTPCAAWCSSTPTLPPPASPTSAPGCGCSTSAGTPRRSRS